MCTHCTVHQVKILTKIFKRKYEFALFFSSVAKRKFSIRSSRKFSGQHIQKYRYTRRSIVVFNIVGCSLDYTTERKSERKIPLYHAPFTHKHTMDEFAQLRSPTQRRKKKRGWMKLKNIIITDLLLLIWMFLLAAFVINDMRRRHRRRQKKKQESPHKNVNKMVQYFITTFESIVHAPT